MRYLRMLLNSLLGGALTAAYMATLVLQLNPSVPLMPADLSALYLVMAASYGVHVAAVFYALIVVRQLFASYLLSPGWLSFAVLSWFATAAAGGASWLMWMNLRTLSPVLDGRTTRGMAIGAAIMTVSAVCFLVLALARYSFGRVGRRVGGALFIAAIILSLALPVWARGPGRPAQPRSTKGGEMVGTIPAARPVRVTMLLLDGGSLDFISQLATEGRLPNFGKMLDSGVAMHLATLRPTQPGPVWSAAFTGKLPAKNGIRSAALYRTRPGLEPIAMLPDFCFSHALVRWGFLREENLTSSDLRARFLWDLLGSAGVGVGVLGCPLTHPAAAVNGFLVSDRFHRYASAASVEDASVIYPPSLLSRAVAWAGGVAEDPPLLPARGAPRGEPSDKRAAGSAHADEAEATLRRLYERASEAIAVDAMYERVAEGLGTGSAPSFVALRFRAVDTVGHDFLRYAMPREFGDVSEEERRRHGAVLISAYAAVDNLVGRLVSGLSADDLLLVVSGFGMEPLVPGKRLVERVLGDADLTGTHERAPDGFLMAYGKSVGQGRRARASILDVVPTVLYFFGLPVARDLDGYARTDVFAPAFTAGRPITFIPTYER
ncbi:MAG: alkaline phosphatase family protein [Vicinamibacterales bacterium]